MMNRYQHHQHPAAHNSNTILPPNHHIHLNGSSESATPATTTTTVLQAPVDAYSSSPNNSIVDLHSQNHYNLLEDNYVYNASPSYCPKHHHQQIYRSPTLCTLDNQASIYDTYSPPNALPVGSQHNNTYEQFCIDHSQTSPSSWLASSSSSTTNETIYHPVQSFDQCNIYLNHSHLPEPVIYRDYSSIPLSNNETSSSSSSSSSSSTTTSSSFNVNPLQHQYRHQAPLHEQSTLIDEKPLAIVANETKYKWMQIKRTPAKTAGNRSCTRAEDSSS